MELFSEFGYDAIELKVAHPPGFFIEDVISLSERHELPVVSLLSGWSYGAEGLCLSSTDAQVRDQINRTFLLD